MPFDVFLRDSFNSQVSNLMANPEFYTLPDDEKGLQLNQVYNNFIEDNNITEKEDKDFFGSSMESNFQEYRNRNLIPRYIPSQEDQSKYYEPLSLSEEDSQDDKITKIDEWKAKSLEKASALRPANKTDFDYHLSYIANEQIRKVAGEDTGYFGDKGDRLLQGIIEPVARLAFGDIPASRFFASRLGENPDYDQDTGAMIAAGIGDTIFQATLAFTTGITAGLEASVAAMGLYNTSRMMRDSYEQEIQRSGNPELALNSAIAQIPAAGLETFADAVLFGTASKIKGFKSAFAKAATREEKEKVLREAIPSIGSHVLKSGLSEATLGGAGAEFSSGYGSYLATGDEKYLRSQEQLFQSAIVEGTVGVLFGAGFSPIVKAGARSELSKELTQNKNSQNQVYNLLKAKNYQGVLDHLSGKTAQQAQAATQTNGQTNQTQPQAGEVKYNKSGGVTFNTKNFRELESFLKAHEADTDPENKQKNQAEYEYKQKALKQMREGTVVPQEDFTVTAPTNKESNGLWFNSKLDEKGPERVLSSHDVILEDGEQLEDDDADHTFFVTDTEKNPVTPETFNKTQVIHGTPTLALSRSGRAIRLGIMRPNGSIEQTTKKGEIPISFNPKVGRIPVKIYEGKDANGNATRRVKIFPKVASANKISLKEGYKYLRSNFENDRVGPDGKLIQGGNLRSVTIQQKGKEVTLQGEQAYEVADAERIKYNDEVIQRFAGRAKNATNAATTSKPSEQAGEVKEEKKEPNILTDEDIFDKELGFVFNTYEKSKTSSIPDGEIDAAIKIIEAKFESIKNKEDPNNIKDDLISLWESLVLTKENQNKQVQIQELEVTPIQTEEVVEDNIEEDEQIQTEKTLADYIGKNIYIDGLFGELSVDPETNRAIITTKDGTQYETVNADIAVSEIEGFADKMPRIIKRNPPEINNRGNLVNKKQTSVGVSTSSIKGAPQQESSNKTEDTFRKLSELKKYKKERGKRVRKKKVEEALAPPKTESTVEDLSNDLKGIVALAKMSAFSKNDIANAISEIAQDNDKFIPYLQQQLDSYDSSDVNDLAELLKIKNEPNYKKGSKSDLKYNRQKELKRREEQRKKLEKEEDEDAGIQREEDEETGDSYSIISKQDKGKKKGIPEQDVKDAILKIYGLDVDVVSKVGTRWNGKSNTNTGKITINARYVNSVNEALNVFAHEVAHLGYVENSTEVNNIISVVADDLKTHGLTVDSAIESLKQIGYGEDAQEEFVVRNVDVLRAQWMRRSGLDQFIQKIVTWFKQKFGRDLNNRDAQYIASKIFQEGLENYRNKQATESKPRYSLNGQEVVSGAIPAGAGLYYSIPNLTQDGEIYLLGGKSIGRKGEVEVAGLMTMGNIKQDEINLYKIISPESFDGIMVNIPNLVQDLKDYGDVIEAKVLHGFDSPSNEYNRLQHEVELRGYDLWLNEDGRVRGVQNRESGSTHKMGAPSWLQIPKEVADLAWKAYKAKGFSGREETAQYEGLAVPKSKLPGYVEFLLRIPQKAGILHSSGHFISSGNNTNIVSFFRAYVEEKDGKKILHVFEVQSDWGQANVKEERRIKELTDTLVNKGNEEWQFKNYDGSIRIENLPGIETKEEAANIIITRNVSNHPILSVFEPLAIKAAIAHAESIDADGIAISDAFTAMMSEGHDKVIARAREDVKSVNEVIKDQKLIEDIETSTLNKRIENELKALQNKYKQSGAKFALIDNEIIMTKEPFMGGMRQHYDHEVRQKIFKVNKDGSLKEEPVIVLRQALREDAENYINKQLDSKNIRPANESADILIEAKEDVINANKNNKELKNELNNLQKKYKQSGAKFAIVEDKIVMTEKPLVREYVIVEAKGSLHAIAERLTGVKGEEVDFGTHDSARDSTAVDPEVHREALARWQAGEINQTQFDNEMSLAEKIVNGSPVFNNKSNVTAKLYTFGKLNQQAQQDRNQSLFRYNLIEDQNDEDGDSQFENEDLISLFTGKKSEARKEVGKYIDDLKATDIEQALLVDEKPAYKSLKSVEYTFLPDAELKEYFEYLQDFVETRSLVDNPQATRIRADEVLTKAAEFQKMALQARFDFLKETHPDLFTKDGKDLTFEDFDNNISVVEELVKKGENAMDLNATEDEREDYITRIEELQPDIQESINSGAIGNMDNLFNHITNLPDLGDEHLNKINAITAEFAVDAKDFYRDFINSLVNLDPRTLDKFRDVRYLYYSLLSIRTDGYPLTSNKFITSKLTSLLQQQGIQFRAPFSSIGISAVEKASSIPTNLYSRMGGKEQADAMYSLTSLYRESLKAAERVNVEVIIPYIEKSVAAREKENGNPFNNVDKVMMGMYSYLRGQHLDEGTTEAFFKNVEWVKLSIKNKTDTNDASVNKAAKQEAENLEKFMEGTDENDPNSMQIFEANAERILGPAKTGLVKDIVRLFNGLEPMAKFATEFAYGKKYQRINNYIPSFSTAIRGPSRFGSAYNESSPATMQDIRLDTNADPIANGTIGQVFNKWSREGMSSIKLRNRVLGKSRILDFDIINLATNRGRLNVLDHFTALRRRELANIINKDNPELAEWLGDPEGKLGKVDLVRRQLTQSWQNEIQTTQYLGKFHQIMNKGIARFASFKLFGIHQLPNQTISNSITYFVQNLTNPAKIMDFFRAVHFYMSAKDDPRYSQLMERLTTEIKNRSQDAVLDKTASMKVDSEGIYQDIKASKIFGHVRDLDNLRQKWMLKPFHWSDMWSGIPMILTEYLHNERARLETQELGFDGLTYNPESYFKSLDETERMIGIGSASRRGIWLHNGNASISLMRNMLTMFASHRVNNATNFSLAARNVADGSLTMEDRSRALQYMTAIVAQTAVFSAVRAGILLFIGKFIINMAKEGEEDDLEELYKKDQSSMSPKQKELLKQEIATRKQMRAAISNFERRNSSAKLLAVNTGKELLANIWFGTAFVDMPTDMLFHLTYDKVETQLFNDAKASELERLGKLRDKYKDSLDRNNYAKVSEAISDLESQEAMEVVFEQHGISLPGGILGPYLKQVYDIAESGVEALFTEEEIGLEEITTTMGVLGAGSPDLQRFLKLREKIISARIKGEKNKEEAIAKLKKDHRILE